MNARLKTKLYLPQDYRLPFFDCGPGEVELLAALRSTSPIFIDSRLNHLAIA